MIDTTISDEDRKRGHRFYRFNKSKVDVKEIPSGFSLEFINRSFLQNKGLQGIDLVREEISSCWSSFDDFMKKGFGVSICHDDKIVG